MNQPQWSWQRGIATTDAGGTGKKKVLLVDDEADLATLLRLNLERIGNYEVRDLNHGSKAIETAREFRPDIILLDVIMPDMAGTEVASRLKDDRDLNGTPIVFLTAVVSREEARMSSNLTNGHPVLAKPASPQEVIAVIEEHLPS